MLNSPMSSPQMMRMLGFPACRAVAWAEAGRAETWAAAGAGLRMRWCREHHEGQCGKRARREAFPLIH